MKRRTPLRAGKGLARRTPLLSRAEKRKRPRYTGPDRTTRELVLERDDYRCACCGASVYERPYSLQHRVARQMGGTPDPAANSPANLITLCGSATSPGGCHIACEQRTEQLNPLGFWLWSWQDPEVEAVAHAVHGWVYLCSDGSVEPVPRLGCVR